ncbi:MAG: hypothetical protein WAV27_21620 [Xanthobacteraceae bacterium]|jgi:hypothetical protein
MRAQVAWQASCWLEQLLRHDPLAVVLVPDDVEEEGATQVYWQVAA